MRVLFVSSGKSGGAGYVVKNQGDSLIRYGIDLEYFSITPGIIGYLRAIPGIRKRVKEGGYDIVHAHYNLSGIVASMAGSFPLVVSLMGSDVHQNFILLWITQVLSKWRWRAVIVKTEAMKEKLRLKRAFVISNGVDTDRFIPAHKEEAREKLGLTGRGKIVLFIASKNRPEKNLSMAEEAVAYLQDKSVEFLHLHSMENSMIPLYLNAADLLLLTSRREGGVNVIKEAMACNCPIVSTDVGDVRWVTSGIDGCYITGSGIPDVAANIKKALDFSARTTGRERIFELGLDSVSVAGKLAEIYNSVSKRVE